MLLGYIDYMKCVVTLPWQDPSNVFTSPVRLPSGYSGPHDPRLITPINHVNSSI